jgi:hypothetical protein
MGSRDEFLETEAETEMKSVKSSLKQLTVGAVLNR